MLWEKKGKIDLAKYLTQDWQKGYQMLPCPLMIDENVIRVFVGFCDSNIIGRIGYVDLEYNDSMRVIKVSKQPVLDIGENGCFDDNGVVPLSVLKCEDRILLYYVGFQQGVKVPYYMFGGLAVSNDGGETFSRVQKTPILDRVGEERYARCGMFVKYEDDLFRMWYIGSVGEGWVNSNGKLRPFYTMRYAESEDGINWKANNDLCLNYKSEDEHGFGRPYVWKDRIGYKMLYSVRTYSKGYYIGYAESENGIKWERKDEEAGISLSDEGWDNENLSYPALLEIKGETYMFYNGNGCGKTGFGFAKLVDA